MWWGLISFFLSFPQAISTPDDEGDEEIVGILTEWSHGILELIYEYYHDEIVGKIEYPDYSYDPFRISHLSGFEERERERIYMYHREKEFFIVYGAYSLIFLSK